MNIKTDKYFKYDYEKLDPTLEEFKFLKETFLTTSFGLPIDIIANGFHIYKVNERNFVKTAVKKRINLMLYHGTSKKGATCILKEGFRNSEKGWFGKGVYMTDCSNTAFIYSFRADMNSSNRLEFIYAILAGQFSNDGYIFVNEVLESEKMQTFEFDPENTKDLSIQPKHQFKRHICRSNLQPTEKNYMVDFEGRRYIKAQEDNIRDEYIAEASVVIPRYLIVLEKQ